MIKHLWVITCRNLVKQKGRSIISVLCITAGLLCFSVCHYFSTIMNRGNEFLETYERQAVIRLENDPRGQIGFPTEKLEELGNEEIEGAACFHNGTSNYRTQSETIYRVNTTYCTHDYFLVFPPQLLEGSLKEFGIRPEVVVVTKEFIRQYADKGTAVGTSITVDQKTYTIGAVIESYPAGMNGYLNSYDLFIFTPQSYGAKTLLLKAPSHIDIVNKRLAMLDWEGYHAKPKCYLASQMPKNQPGAELYVSIIGMIILAVALINYFSFSIGSFVNRSRELALRQCLGGKGSSLFSLLFAEQFLILTLSCILTLALSESLLPAFINSLDYNIRRELEIDIPILLASEIKYSVCLMALSLMLCYVSVARIIRSMHRQGLSRRNNKGKHWLRNISLGLQFFFSLLFLIGIAGMYLQMQSYSDNSTPLLTDEEKEHFILASTRSSVDNKLDKELTEVCDYFRSQSWCESLSLFSYGTTQIKHHRIIVHQVSEEYLDQMKVEKKHKPGEKFAYITPAIDTEIRVDTFFQSIKFVDFEYPITGQCHVFPNLRHNTPYLAIVPLEKDWIPDKMIIQLKQGANREQAMQNIREKLSPYFAANAPCEITTFYEDQVGYLSLLRNLFIVSAVISLLITILGIYHSIQIDTERRQKEVAVRKVNGACVRDIYRLFGKNYVVLYLVSVLLAVSLCLFLMIMAGRMIEFDYAHPLLWLLPLLTAALVILLTISWRIYRVARINPAEIIKTE